MSLGPSGVVPFAPPALAAAGGSTDAIVAKAARSVNTEFTDQTSNYDGTHANLADTPARTGRASVVTSLAEPTATTLPAYSNEPIPDNPQSPVAVTPFWGPTGLDQFNSAAGNPPIAVNFDNIAPGTNISGTRIGGITFRKGDGTAAEAADLIVVRASDTWTPADGWIPTPIPTPSRFKLPATSGTNIVSPGDTRLGPGPAPTVENDDLDITFDAPVRAIGFDVVFQSLDVDPRVRITAYTGAQSITYADLHVPITYPVGSPGGAWFVGFVSSATDITRVVVDDWDSDNDNPDANIGFDTFRKTGDSAIVQSNELRCGGNPSELPASASVGDLVDTANGNLCQSSTDIAVPGRGMSLLFNRTYNSLDITQTDALTLTRPLGYGWTHSYNMYLKSDPVQRTYLVYQENGSVAQFNWDFSHPIWVLATLAYDSASQTFVFTRTHGQDRFYFKSINNSGASGIYKLDRMIDRNNYTTALAYDGMGRLSTVTAPGNRTLAFTYFCNDCPSNPLGYFIYSVRDDTLRTVRFGYTNNDLTSVRDVRKKPTGLYYTNHQLRTIIDPNNGPTSNYYDSNNRLTTQCDPMSRCLQLEYTNLGAGKTRTTMTDTLNVVVTHDYEWNKLLQVTNKTHRPTPAIWTYEYSPVLGVTSVTDPNRHLWTSTWDLAGNLTSTTEPPRIPRPFTDNTTYYAYYPTNDLAVITDSVGVRTTFRYDTYGNLSTVSRPLTQTRQVATTRYGYSLIMRGDVLTITNPLGKSSHLTYDANGYVRTSSNPLGETSVFTNSRLGMPLMATDPMVHSTTYAYNEFNQPTAITNALGYITSLSYDNVGNLRTETDANHHTITYTYNLDNELTRVTRLDGSHSDTDYDAHGRVVIQTNPLGQTTRYIYDDAKWVTTVTRPGPTSVRLQQKYWNDPAGNLTTYDDEQGRRTSFNYFPNNQLFSIGYSDGGHTPPVTYDYDSRGLRTLMTDGLGRVRYGYDSLERLTSVSREYLGAIGSQVNYDYDLADNTKSIKYPANRDGVRRMITYTYDLADRMDTLKGTNAGSGGQERRLASFHYDHSGNLTKMETEPDVGLTRRFGYDRASQMITTTSSLNNPPIVSQAITYTRTPLGFVKNSYQFKDRPLDISPVVTTHTYEYDGLNRLIGDDSDSTFTLEIFSTTFEMDSANQVKQTVIRPQNDPVRTIRYDYDNANQLVAMTTTIGSSPTPEVAIFRYDNSGNRLLEERRVPSYPVPLETIYTYDQANRLQTYDSRDEYGTGGTGTYMYDGDGLRIRRNPTYPDSLDAPDSPGSSPDYTRLLTTTWDLRPGLPLVLQDLGYATEGGDHNFIYGPGGMLLGQLGRPAYLLDKPPSDKGEKAGTGGSVGGTQGQDGKKGNGTPQPQVPLDVYSYAFYLTDQADSVDGLIVNNRLVTTYSYDAYGRRSGPWLPLNETPFGFTGQYQDKESAMLYLRGRYYDPATQQFISRDPSEAISGQPYAYANRNPINFVDPDGAMPFFQTGNKSEGGGPKGQGGAIGPRPLPPGSAQAAGAVQAASKSRLELAMESGSEGEAAFAKANPTFIKRTFQTSQGGPRHVDFYDPITKTIHEIKTGLQGARSKITRQIAKDVELLYEGEVNGVVWHFFRSPINGTIGATGPLEELLRQTPARESFFPNTFRLEFHP